MAKDSGRSSDLYGSDPKGASDAIETKLSVPEPTLDVHGESDKRATSEGNHGKA